MSAEAIRYLAGIVKRHEDADIVTVGLPFVAESWREVRAVTGLGEPIAISWVVLCALLLVWGWLHSLDSALGARREYALVPARVDSKEARDVRM